MAALDDDGSGEISFDEFFAFATKLTKFLETCDPEEMIRARAGAERHASARAGGGSSRLGARRGRLCTSFRVSREASRNSARVDEG